MVNVSERAIHDRLVEFGRGLKGESTSVPEANALLNDLERHPHAFVLACLMDLLVDYERAWLVPFKISQKLSGEFSIEVLSQLSPGEVNELMSGPPPLIPFFNKMSDRFYRAVKRIANVYGGNAARIWMGKPPSAEVVYRFLEFDGVGPKIATMAANILARDYKIEFADRSSIDISTDTHVCQVFARLGLCQSEPTFEKVMYKARALNPDYPGIIDLPCWEIGNRWCKRGKPLCDDCCMKDLCPKRV
ncbi:MAG: iron-sulfur cluster loop [Bryobacteraceae bacterium]|jgi:endonuclease III